MNEYLQVGSTSPSYDPNGNLLYNGDDATYTWNINNRLLTVAKANGDTGSYRYDPLGRRVARRASIASVTTETYYLHNGWNVELEHDGTRYTHRRSWGLDLSGSLQGAGGVGGLIMTEHLDASGNASHNYYPSYDGNGNITALIDHQGNLAATWRYDAYGNTLATTGDPSLENYRFSTKPYDELTGFYYYGYRYYDPQTGRWPSRDPIGQIGSFEWFSRRTQILLQESEYLKTTWVYGSRATEAEAFELELDLRLSVNRWKYAAIFETSESLGGLNLYAMLSNDPLNDGDLLGLCPFVGAAKTTKSPEFLGKCLCQRWICIDVTPPHDGTSRFALLVWAPDGKPYACDP